MFKSRILFLACLTAAIAAAPFTARAEDFCSSLNKVIGDAPNGFSGISAEKPGAAPTASTVTMPGFSADMGADAGGMKSCNVIATGGDAIYTCMSNKATSLDVADEAKKCLPDWTKTEMEQNGAKMVSLTKGTVGVTVSSSAAPAAVSLTVSAASAK